MPRRVMAGILVAILTATFVASRAEAGKPRLGNRTQAAIAVASGSSMALGYFLHVPQLYFGGMLGFSFVVTYRVIKSLPRKKKSGRDKEFAEGSMALPMPEKRERLRLPSWPALEKVKWEFRKAFHIMPKGRDYGWHE